MNNGEDVYKVMVKVRNDDSGLPPYRHLDTLELPKGEQNPIEGEKDLVSLLFLIYRREMDVALQVSSNGFKTVYKASIEPVFKKRYGGENQLKFLKFKSFEKNLEYYLDINSLQNVDNRSIKIENPKSMVPSNFLEEKKEDLHESRKKS